MFEQDVLEGFNEEMEKTAILGKAIGSLAKHILKKQKINTLFGSMSVGGSMAKARKSINPKKIVPGSYKPYNPASITTRYY